MSTLPITATNLSAEISAALVSDGYKKFAQQIMSGIIERCTYDEEADAGYIYLVRPTPSLHFTKLSSPVAETISFAAGFNIDIDHDGNIFGIEFLDRTDFVAEIKRARLL